MTTPAYDTLIESADLYPQLANPQWALVDCRFELTRPAAGRAAFAQAHIPGAIYAHLDEDLAAPITPDSGRHPLPDAQALAERLGRWGIGNDTQVIAYDQANGAFAARLWWLLRWLG